MGGIGSKEFEGSHLIPFFKIGDNKLYIYQPDKDRFLSFSIYNKGKKYKFFAQETITVPSGALYIIGGCTIEEEDDQILNHPELIAQSLVPTQFVAKVNLNKHEGYSIDISKMKPCRMLPQARRSHVMTYCNKQIFVMGGIIDEEETVTKKCLKFDTKSRSWSEISDLKNTVTFLEPCALPVNDQNIYLFETGLVREEGIPQIFKYEIETDYWTEVVVKHKNKDVSIPPTLNCTVLQMSESEIMIVSGVTMKDDQLEQTKGFHFTFNLMSNEFSMPVYDDALDFWSKDRQGWVNYTKSPCVYHRLGDSNIRMYRKSQKEWSEVELSLEDKAPMGGCFSTGR